MKTLSEVTKNYFLGFYFGDIPVSEFLSWLYTSNFIQEELDDDQYFSLIDLDLNVRDDKDEAKKIVKTIYDNQREDQIVYDRVKNILTSMLENRMSLKDGCKILADLYVDGYSFISSFFVGYSSELEEPDNEKFYRDRIISDSRKLLNQITFDIKPLNPKNKPLL